MDQQQNKFQKKQLNEMLKPSDSSEIYQEYRDFFIADTLQAIENKVA